MKQLVIAIEKLKVIAETSTDMDAVSSAYLKIDILELALEILRGGL